MKWSGRVGEGAGGMGESLAGREQNRVKYYIYVKLITIDI
jgi:hypothetical protein